MSELLSGLVIPLKETFKYVMIIIVTQAILAYIRRVNKFESIKNKFV